MITILSVSFLFGQDNGLPTFDLNNPIIITASRMPSSLMRSARTVSILDSASLAQIPANSVQDALKYIAGVDIQQRGSQGIQGDVRLRGSSYEQVLILVDGVKVNDPQTGHHNLDIPINLQSVKRIEVVKGAGSRLYGPNAMSGVINIITKSAHGRHLNFSLTGGDFGYKEAVANVDFKTFKIKHGLSFSGSSSKGYRPNTDFTNYTLTYKNQITLARSRIALMAGFNSKDFGANQFYNPSFPNQKEKTKVFYFNTSGKFSIDNRSIMVSPKIYWRHHYDDFLLDYTRPDWYHNKHKTDVAGGEVLTNISSRFGNSSLQFEWQINKITSNNLGDHHRFQAGFSTEHQITWHAWQIVFGSTFYHYTNWGWQICPGLDISYQVNPNLTFYSSIDKGYRPPSYTELFYFSAANHGSSALRPEYSVDVEFGVRHQTFRTFSSMALFRRHGTNLIDWIYKNEGKFWQATNITDMTTSGLEFSYQYRPKQKLLKTFIINYTYLTSDKSSNGLISKYVFNYLKHQLIVGINQSLLNPKFLVNWELRYEDRANAENYLITDVHLQWQIKKYLIFTDISNLFNQHYEDFIAIPQPGRWLKLGLKYQVF